VDFKNSIKLPGPWRIGLAVSANACLSQNYVESTKTVDAWGIPTLKIHCEWGDNEKTMSKDIAVQAAEMLAAAAQGHLCLSGYVPPGLGIHEMGTPAWAAIQDLRLE